MNKETFLKRFKPLCCKDGSFKGNNDYFLYRILNSVIVGNNTIKYSLWHKNGRHFSLEDNFIKYANIFNALKISFKLDNISPKGGKEGDVIIINNINNVRRNLKPLLEEYKKNKFISPFKK